MTSESTSRTTPLLRQLGLVSATALVVSNMIGTGIFTTTGFMVGDLGSARLVLMVYGLEVWNRGTWLQRYMLHRTDSVVAISAFTMKKLREWAVIAGPSVSSPQCSRPARRLRPVLPQHRIERPRDFPTSS